MTYQEFKQTIMDTIQAELGSAFRIFIQDITKNNNTHLDGLTILSKKCNFSPTIYLNYYYEQFLQGTALSAICEEILTHYKQQVSHPFLDLSFFTDYQKVKKQIIFKLINYERNRELLKEIPHFRYLDLAIVFCCLLHSDTNGYGTILIHNHHLSFWNITADDLYTLAMKNTPILLNYDLQNMTDVLKNLFSADAVLPDEFLTHPVSMYVLSNQTKLNGSGCILYCNLLAEISEKLDCDFYILPSSIHEVLLIPAKDKTSRKRLSAMVQEINETQLLQEEVLSDHVYYYSRKTKKLSF